jgi:replication factor A1
LALCFRFRVPIIASGDDSSVEMVFFGDIARDLVGKPVDVLLAESSSPLSVVPDEISALIGRTYVVDVVVSRFSFRSSDMSFQVLKLYPEGSSVFASLNTELPPGSKADASLDDDVSDESQSSKSGKALLCYYFFLLYV